MCHPKLILNYSNLPEYLVFVFLTPISPFLQVFSLFHRSVSVRGDVKPTIVT